MTLYVEASILDNKQAAGSPQDVACDSLMTGRGSSSSAPTQQPTSSRGEKPLSGVWERAPNSKGGKTRLLISPGGGCSSSNRPAE